MGSRGVPGGGGGGRGSAGQGTQSFKRRRSPHRHASNRQTTAGARPGRVQPAAPRPGEACTARGPWFGEGRMRSPVPHRVLPPPPPKQLKQEKKPPGRFSVCLRFAAAMLALLTVGTPRLGGGLSKGGPEPSSHRHIRSARGGEGAGVWAKQARFRAGVTAATQLLHLHLLTHKMQSSHACQHPIAHMHAARPGAPHAPATPDAPLQCSAPDEERPVASGREAYCSSLLWLATFSSVSVERYLMRTGPSTTAASLLLGPSSPGGKPLLSTTPRSLERVEERDRTGAENASVVWLGGVSHQREVQQRQRGASNRLCD